MCSYQGNTLRVERENMKATTSNKVCKPCGADVHPLEVFPHDSGIQCLTCYEKEQASQPMPTAGEIRRMWGM